MARNRDPLQVPDGDWVCPFCRMPFPSALTCPDHDLPLVDPAELGASSGAGLPALDETVDLWDLRYGRGWVMAGAAALLVAFLLPWVTTRAGTEAWTVTGLSFSTSKGAILWIVPAAGAGLLWLMRVRRTRRALRGLRLAVPILALSAFTAGAYVTWGFARGAAVLEGRTGDSVRVWLEPGAYLALAGVGVVLLGASRLGGARRPGSASGSAP